MFQVIVLDNGGAALRARSLNTASWREEAMRYAMPGKTVIIQQWRKAGNTWAWVSISAIHG